MDKPIKGMIVKAGRTISLIHMTDGSPRFYVDVADSKAVGEDKLEDLLDRLRNTYPDFCVYYITDEQIADMKQIIARYEEMMS